MTDLSTQSRDEAARLRAAGDDGAADLMDALRKENERLREAMGEIAEREWHEVEPNGADIPLGIAPWVAELDEASLEMQNTARAALNPHGAVTPETKGET